VPSLGLPETSMIWKILCLTLWWVCDLSLNLSVLSFLGGLLFQLYLRQCPLWLPRRHVSRLLLQIHLCLSIQC
jgi:hypothetical protein